MSVEPVRALVAFGRPIAAPAAKFAALAQARQDALVKPRGALGRLEEIACWFAARQRRVIPEPIRPAITVFAADHGVTRHAVSAYPASVTALMVDGIARGVAAINVLARAIDAVFSIVDVGVSRASTESAVYSERIAAGSADLASAPAMSESQVNRALEIGAQYARKAVAERCTLLIAGEIGIGNTTSAACIVASMLEADPNDVVGTGSGIDEEGRECKLAVVRRALARTKRPLEPLQVLREWGGFEIAAMTGFYLESARQGVPCLLDGFISSAAALVGCAMEPGLREWLLASHRSAERGHRAALEHLEMTPLVELSMRLGEGTGAALVVPILQNALKLHAQMATFSQAGVPDRI